MRWIASDEFNVKARTRTPGGWLNVPRDCDECGDFWRLDAPECGARYRSGDRWLCTGCAQKKRPGD